MTELIFIFAYFINNGEAGMRLASSADGLHWEDIPGLEFVITPEKGIMRDPFLYLGPDNTFHLIWTTDWESQEIGYSKSIDLIHWEPQRNLPVMTSISGTRNCWAPEMIYNETKENYLIYWASTVPDSQETDEIPSENNYYHRIWSTQTKDFQSFSKPEIFFDPGFNVIDLTLFESPQGGYRIIAKNETLTPVEKNLFSSESPSLFDQWSPPSKAFTESWVEGPSTLIIDDWTYIYYDAYTSKKYGAVRTKDFVSFENISDKVSFPSGARHGSILTISKARFQELLLSPIKQ